MRWAKAIALPTSPGPQTLFLGEPQGRTHEQAGVALTQVERQLGVPQVAPHKVPQIPHWRRRTG